MILLFSFSVFAQSNLERVVIGNGYKVDFPLDAFVYKPQDPSIKIKGVMITIGGSGFTKGGFGGPSRFSKGSTEYGFIGFEWNKRGITTNETLTTIEINEEIYKTATLRKIYEDAEAALKFIGERYPKLPIYIVGGSEGSVITTLLAEFHKNEIAGISAFGVVVPAFIEIMVHQLGNQIVHKRWHEFDKNLDGYLDIDEFKTLELMDNESLVNWIMFKEYGFKNIDVTGDNLASKEELLRVVTDYLVADQGGEHQTMWMETSGIAPGYFQSIFGISSLYRRIKSIEVPTLFMHGEEDILTPVKYVYRLNTVVNTFNLKNVNFKYYAGVGHAPGPQMFEDCIKFFLDLSI